MNQNAWHHNMTKDLIPHQAREGRRFKVCQVFFGYHLIGEGLKRIVTAIVYINLWLYQLFGVNSVVGRQSAGYSATYNGLDRGGIYGLAL